MGYNFFPKTTNFDQLLSEQIAQVVASSQLLEEMCHNLIPSFIEQNLITINKIEEKGTAISREISRQLDQTFITSIDREDIHEINKATSRVLDVFRQIANYICIYSFIPIPQPAKKLATNLKIMVEHAEYMLKKLTNKKYNIIQHLIEIKRIKKKSDKILVEILTESYRPRNLGSQELLIIILWSYIYDRLERAVCRIDYLAEVIEGVILKNV